MARVVRFLMACIAIVSPLWAEAASAEPARTVVATRDVVVRVLRERAPSLAVGGVRDAGHSYEVEVVSFLVFLLLKFNRIHVARAVSFQAQGG